MRRLLPLLFVALGGACSSTSSSSPATTIPEGGTSLEDGGSTPEEDGGTSDTGATPTCPKIAPATALATVAAPAVNEASGIVASSLNADAFWVHNDSGDSARAFAIGSDGKLLATLAFDTTMPTDIEDMAIEDQGAASFLYFGDIGDNGEARASITIHRVAEPKLAGTAQLTATSEKMTVTYSDGPHNAETLLFDPIDKVLLIATKKEGGPSAIHRIGAFAPGAKALTQAIATVPIDLATGGEISRDGKLIAIRGYLTAYLWTRAEGESLATALARPPCTTPIKGELQGESLGFIISAAKKGFVTLSEGASPTLNFHGVE